MCRALVPPHSRLLREHEGPVKVGRRRSSEMHLNWRLRDGGVCSIVCELLAILWNLRCVPKFGLEVQASGRIDTACRNRTDALV